MEEEFGTPRTEFGGLVVIDPRKVLRLGLSIGANQIDSLEKLWESAEKEPRFLSLNVGVLIHQNKVTINEVLYSFRFYTPENNILAKPECAILPFKKH